MKAGDLNTGEKITWCPGCLDFSVMLAAKQAIANLVNENKIELNKVVGVSGVGCHDKIFDYIKTNFYHALHGRVMPTVFGIKFGNPELKVIGFGGDGATYSEGIAHLVHACRYNADVTFIVLNNQVFSLTTGQATPASEKGLVTPSTPLGTKEFPVNPVNLTLTCGATFVARGSAFDMPHLTKIIEEAIMHKGFSFVEIVLPCISYHNNTQFLREHVYKLENHDASSHKEAMKKSL
ncbi:MAG: 2-oxoacid:ferredoxin oxidoreductase subunit beta, partial [Candidatus Aenigmarchaeota archaeon]|nr:2-oxoacid:ferredoxin oxidoreductase subunit beta [Candidatus Aenigmarchaeota archaeon]